MRHILKWRSPLFRWLWINRKQLKVFVELEFPIFSSDKLIWELGGLKIPYEQLDERQQLLYHLLWIKLRIVDLEYGN